MLQAWVTSVMCLRGGVGDVCVRERKGGEVVEERKGVEIPSERPGQNAVCVNHRLTFREAGALFCGQLPCVPRCKGGGLVCEIWR